MADQIRLKRRAAGGAAGAPASLLSAEPAYNEQDDVLYYGKGNSAGAATGIIPIGGPGAFLSLSANATITGTKTMIGTWDATGGSTSVATPVAGDNTQKAANTAWVRGYAQALSVELNAYAALVTTGSVHRTAAGTIVSRTLTGTAGRLTVNNGDGVAGNPVVDLATLSIGGAGVGTFTKQTVDTYGRTTWTGQASLNDLAAPSAAFSMNSFALTNLPDPVNPQDAATKNYVDLARQGLDAKDSVRVAVGSNITINSPGATLDGVTMAAGNRVLLTGQTVGGTNGIYVWNGAATPMTRATDANTSDKVTAGMYTFVEEGTSQDKGFILITDGAVTLGTTSLNFTIFNASGATYSFSTGLNNSGGNVSLTGQALAFHNLGTTGMVTLTASGVVAARSIQGVAGRTTVTNGSGVAADPTVDIASTYAGQATITTLGTISTGTWQGTAVAVAYGGTGASDAAGARTNLGLGSLSTQAANNVAITGGTISGITLDNVVIDGGTF